ncbi:heterokaryon incompatibility protein-domain-containing protein [Xylariaceae sp. FL0255]|nr:heterokaryon incompatibility protein-domain-containing protein [Xylariaceae sp. FL0255]
MSQTLDGWETKQSRAFHLLPQIAEMLAWDYGNEPMPSRSDVFIAAVPNPFPKIIDGLNETMIMAMAFKHGFLVYTDQETSKGRNWLGTCKSNHARCRIHRRREASLNLINCQQRKVYNLSDLKSDSYPEYVALSYVWGDNAGQQKIPSGKNNLPPALPQVVEDSIQVALKLGYSYLWVDKYCVDSQDKAKKHEQLMHMDSVYQNAALTIVAAAGANESYGLPGISKKRIPQQIEFEGEDFTLMSTLPLPHRSITNSHWASRGWTYQEAILSRRRLVFTENQLYFECNSMSCCESFSIDMDKKSSEIDPNSLPLTQPSLFSLKQLHSPGASGQSARLSNFFTYVNCTEEYSRRKLSYDRDSLTAFSGIIRMLESFTAFPVRHIWGIPLFHPDDDDLQSDTLASTYQSFQVPPFWKTPGINYAVSPEKASVLKEGVDYLAFLLLGLGWRHDPTLERPRRRNDLPSWSWTGWQGAVTWPRLDQSSVIRTLPWLSTSITLGDSCTESVPAMYHKATDLHLLVQSNKSLFIRTLAMSRTAFILDKSANILCLSTGQRVKFYPSKSDLDAPKAHKRLQSERYEVIILATVDQDTYMMLVKKYRNSYYRIGTMAVNTAYLTMPLFTSKIKTYKLR